MFTLSQYSQKISPLFKIIHIDMSSSDSGCTVYIFKFVLYNVYVIQRSHACTFYRDIYIVTVSCMLTTTSSQYGELQVS